MSNEEQAVRTVTDPAADAASVLAAAARVPASEPATLWSGVANDARFPAVHRGIAAWHLIARHLPSGTAVADAAHTLAGARWLADAGLDKITAMGGELPVIVPDGGAAFVLRLPRGDAAAVPELGAYLALDRDADEVTLAAALAGDPAGAAITGARLTGVAMFPASLSPAP